VHRQQGACRIGQFAKAIDQFLLHHRQIVRGLATRQSFVQHQPFVDVGTVIFRQQRGQVQVDFRHYAERLAHVGFFAGPEACHRTGQHVVVERKTDFENFTALLLAQHFAGATDFQILHGEMKTGAEFFHQLNGFQAFFCLRRQGAVLVHQQVGERLVVRASDPASELM
jgi:hypothetical protein